MAQSEKEDEAKRIILQIGKQLSAFKTCPNKDTLVKLLKQATNALPDLKQSGSLKVSVMPLCDFLFKHGLLKNKDKDVRILVGTCLCQVIRILAPNPDCSHLVSRDFFTFLLSIFGELDDTASPYFSRKAKLLETIAKLRFCLLMLDIECEDLVLKMFRSFFNVVRDDHPQCLINSMASILSSILEEKLETDADPTEKNTSQPLLDVIFQNIIKERKGLGTSQLAESIIKDCGEKLEHYISRFLTSCIVKRDDVKSAIKESYHEIILELFQTAPQVLLSVIPHLTHELRTEQVDVRIKALNLLKKLLALRGQHVVREYRHIFIELLDRFSDKSVEVRLAALSCAKALYMTNPSTTESLETLSAIQGRLLDHDDKVRIEAVDLVCDITKTNLNLKSSDLVTHAAERLRDKKVSVRSKALKKLVELYHEYCTRCAADITLHNDIIEEVPCKILLLCYEKDCQEYRPQSIELVLSDLFPASLSIEERMKHWTFMSSLFKPLHIKALKVILSQKRRLRDGLKEYLDLCNRTQINGSREGERELEALVRKMSSCFPDPDKAKDLFQKFEGGLDTGVVGLLQQSLSEGAALDTVVMKDLCRRELGDQRAFIEFLHQLSKKCSFNIFGSEHVRYIIDSLSSGESSKQHLKYYQVQLLLTIISVFPSLLRGLEKRFQLLLLEREIPFNEQLIEILAREGQNMPIKLSDIYSLLKKVCLEGTRVQSKLAVSAIVALADASEQLIFPELCQALVDALHNGCNTPTILQSIGCMAQHSVPAFEDQEKAIADYIVEEIFHQNDALASKDLGFSGDTSGCCTSCKLKIFGLKSLVRSFLPYRPRSISRPISSVLDIIQQMLQNSGSFAGSMQCDDEAIIRLAAAKSVLRLSRKWDLHISREIFHLTILTAKDHSPDVRRSFARKVHKLLNNHTLPSRYACTFSFAALDLFKDLRTDAIKYLEDFVREYGKGAKLHETISVRGPAHPVYMIVFLIHVLAHDSNFPAHDCQDDKTYAQFFSPLFVTVHALVNKSSVDANLSLVSNASDLRIVFNAIKKAEDAVDSRMTPKLHLLAEVGISILDSLNIVKRDGKHSPGSILLPSSLYKSIAAERKEADAYKADSSFVKNLVSQLKTEVSRIYAMDMHPKQLNEKSVRTSGRRHATRSNSKSGHTNNLLIDTTEKQIDELHAEERDKHDTPNGESEASGQQDGLKLSTLGSAVLRESSSAENGHEVGVENTTNTPSVSQQEFFVSSSREDDARVKSRDANSCNASKENFPRNKDTYSRKGSRAGKRTKRGEDSSGTLESDITNLDGYPIARRTRRQKV